MILSKDKKRLRETSNYYEPFPIIKKVFDSDTYNRNLVLSNLIYSSYIYHYSSIDLFINKIKQSLIVLKYTSILILNNNELYVLSFNSPLFIYCKIRIIEYKYEQHEYSFAYIFEYIDGYKNYMYSLNKWICINIRSNEESNILSFHPQIHNKIYEIDHTNIIILLDRLQSNKDTYVNNAIDNLCLLMYNKINTNILIEYNLIKILLDYIIFSYTRIYEYNDNLIELLQSSSLESEKYFKNISGNLINASIVLFCILNKINFPNTKFILKDLSLLSELEKRTNISIQKLYEYDKESDIEKDTTMNLSKQSGDKELLSGTSVKENTMNLSKQSGDKELVSIVETKDNTEKVLTITNSILSRNILNIKDYHLLFFNKIKLIVNDHNLKINFFIRLCSYISEKIN